MAITGTGDTTLDKIIKFIASLTGMRSTGAATRPREVLDALFIAIKDHIEPGRQQPGVHYEVAITGDPYASTPTSANVPKIRVVEDAAALAAWAAPNGSMAIVIDAAAANQQLYTRRGGAWEAK